MHNNTFAKFTLTTLSAFAISACGSSGGGSDNSLTSANNQVQNQSSNNQTQLPTQPSQPQVASGTGGVLVISGFDNNAKVKRETLNDYNTTSINVDGINVTIALPNIYPGSSNGWSMGSTNDSYIETCCGRYSDMRFGAASSISANANDYLFYNGNPTENMPKSGSASYTGQSIISANIPTLADEDYYTGTSKFNVDFGNKTLNGSLDIANIQPVNVNATISGNSFAGTANSASLPSAARVEGKFYGNAAKELAGLAQSNDNSWGVAFGAQKQ